ncbi:hypothetical protein GCM10022243_47730 [Saccharothrix violaceirubra]|uniref:Secreted protein n=1 Tax=Saccharothrix violaceirubra TaxID=413306 RepID=A0A7W7WXI7_9PSEU|nr:hypothetical protein [Saccharothrix violaceirubra]MBB4967489.1 hypothetical protein [Saccharothrix violaceirubra]
MMRILAAVFAVVWALVLPRAAGASADSWWVTEGYRNDQAECVAEKNATWATGFVVSPAGPTCLHIPRGYYYQYLDT